MAEEQPKFQRRTVLVKRSLQLKYAAIVFTAVLLTAALVGGDAYYTIMRIIESENPAMMPLIGQAVRIGAVKMSVFLGIMFLVSLFVSHRFAGPIYRFERSAQVIASGDLTHRVSLRTGDDLMELQDELNAMVSSLQRLVQKDRALVERLSTRIDLTLKEFSGTSDPKAVERLREELRAMQNELRHLTRSFTI